jgi:hypothetical protein
MNLVSTKLAYIYFEISGRDYTVHVTIVLSESCCTLRLGYVDLISTQRLSERRSAESVCE